MFVILVRFFTAVWILLPVKKFFYVYFQEVKINAK